MQISSYQHSQSTSSYQHFYPKEVILQLISLKQYGIVYPEFSTKQKCALMLLNNRAYPEWM